MSEPVTQLSAATKALTLTLRKASSTLFSTSLALARDSALAVKEATRAAWHATRAVYSAAVEVAAETLYFAAAFAGPAAGIGSYFAFHFVPGLVVGCAWLLFMLAAVLVYRNKPTGLDVRSRPRWMSVAGHVVVAALLLAGPAVLAVRKVPALQTIHWRLHRPAKPVKGTFLAHPTQTALA